MLFRSDDDDDDDDDGGDDGDLDLVINRLNNHVGLYKNNSTAPRIAIRLEGFNNNSQAIGAKIKVKGDNIYQSREIISGGRYLSGSDPLQVFAANDSFMLAEIQWRDGTITVIDSLVKNQLYTIRQIKRNSIDIVKSKVNPIFKDMSQLLNHTHHEDPYDDFLYQSLLPNRFSQMGPGVAWIDSDFDGDDDLFIASGKGGSIDHFENKDGDSFIPFSVEKNLQEDVTSIISTVDNNGNQGIIVGNSNFESQLGAKSSISNFTREEKKEKKKKKEKD